LLGSIKINAPNLCWYLSQKVLLQRETWGYHKKERKKVKQGEREDRKKKKEKKRW
jgi:hypothetical protein